MPATIRDVARHAKVGIATVSRVLNESPSVSEETRQRVLAAIEELDYIPNPIARKLSIGRTLTIGVILPYLTLPSYVERLRGIQHALEETEYDLVLFSAETPQQRDAYFENLSHRSRMDGVIIISMPPTDKQADRFNKANQCVILIDALHPKLPCIIVDDFEGGRMATEQLIQQGHRKIAFISDFLETPFHPSMRYRFHGYRRALEENNIPFRSEYQLQGDRGRTHAREMAQSLFSLPDPPTAIFAASDTHAIGALDYAADNQVRIPEDISVIGFDGIRDSEYLRLSTIDQHLYESGLEGVNLLLKKLAPGNKLSNTPVQLPLTLISRNTVGPPAVSTKAV